MHTVQTKKITQNVGRSILVPDFWIWRPVVDIPQPRFREGAGGEVSRKSKIWPKMAFFGPGRSWRPLILHVLGPRWRLGSPALRLPPQASQGPTAPTQPRTCTYMYIAWHARYGRAFEPRGASAQRTAARRHAQRFACTSAGALAAYARACLLLARDRHQFAGLYGTSRAVHVLCMCCAMLCYAVHVHVLCSACACASAVHALCMCYVCAVISCVCAVLCCAVLCCAWFVLRMPCSYACAMHVLHVFPVHVHVLCMCCACNLPRNRGTKKCQCLHQREVLANDT